MKKKYFCKRYASVYDKIIGNKINNNEMFNFILKCRHMNKLTPNINKMERGFAASVMLNVSQGWAVNKKARKKYMLSKFL